MEQTLNLTLNSLMAQVLLALTLAGCGGVAPNLSSDDPDERRLGLLELRGRRDAEAVRIMVDRLADKDDLVRKTAVDLLAGLKDRAVLQHILPILKDGGDIVRASACRAIGDLGGDDVVPDLISFLKKEASSQVRREAVAALARLSSTPAALETLIEAVGDGDPAVAHSAHRALTEIAGGAEQERTVQAWQKWFSDHPLKR